MAETRVKQILATSTHQTLHKRYQHNLNQIKSIRRRSNLTIARAGKNRAIVIINKDSLEQKIQENHITHMNKNPTDLYQKQIQQALQKCYTLIEKGRRKHVMNIKPTALSLTTYIKTHKKDEPIRPVIIHKNHRTRSPNFSTKNCEA
jgi:hypothetical protein